MKRSDAMKALVLSACALAAALPGCESVLSNPNFEDYACSGVDCSDPDTLADVQALPERGMVAAQLTCNSVALGAGPSPASSRFYYQATRFIDGSCLASATIGSGTDKAVGSSFWRRGSPNADTCLVQAALPAFVPAIARVQGGQVHIESPTCGGGAGCTTSVLFCSGDTADFL
jgi:hypothetical protein